jgi:hypothetical protein
MSNDRMTRIYTELENEVIPSMNESQKTELLINSKLKQFQEKFFSIVVQNCKHSYDWIQENTKPEQTGNGINFVLKDDSKKQEAQEYFREFQECSAKHDFGLKGIIESSKNQVSNINNSFISCSNQCVVSPDSKSDDELKSCLRTCFNSTLQQSQDIQNNLNFKIDEILGQINKF